MLSEHVVCETVDKVLYPKAKELADLVHDLHRKLEPLSGPQGMTGSNELDFAIQLLDGAITKLVAIARYHQIAVTRFDSLYLHENYKKVGDFWYKASSEDMQDSSLMRLTKRGELLFPEQASKK